MKVLCEISMTFYVVLGQECHERIHAGVIVKGLAF